MTVPVEMFDMLIAPIREADKRDGHDFLKRYLEGAQYVWETTDEKIRSVPTLTSVDECPDEFLQFLKNIVGWTKLLHTITDELTYDELRRLISISGRLWKLRGTEDTVVDVMRFATGERSRIWNWFDFRWIIPMTGPPDSCTWSSPNLTHTVTELIGSDDATGTPLRITYLPTSVYEDVVVQWVSGANVVVTTALGQGGSPSTTASDYEVRLLSPFGTELGEEHEGRDPWVVSMPDETDTPEDERYKAQYESNLRVVINPAWDADEVARMKRLIVNLMSQLLRPTGERWEIIYLGFLDQFIEDGDDTQWDPYAPSPAPAIEDGVMKFGVTDDWEAYDTNIPEGEWDYAAYTCRFRCLEVGAPFFFPPYFGFVLWADHTAETGYILWLIPDGSASSPNQVMLGRQTGPGTVIELQVVDLSNIYPLFQDVWYTLRITFVPTNDDNLVQVFLDGELVIEYLDTDPLTADGVVNIGSNLIVAEVDEMEILPLPVKDEYIDINS